MNFFTAPEILMEVEAKSGLFKVTLVIGLNKANSLRKQDLDVIDSNEFNYFPRKHDISWKDAKVDCEDVCLLDENSEQYTLGQKLWIISMKNQPKAA